MARGARVCSEQLLVSSAGLLKAPLSCKAWAIRLGFRDPIVSA